ncbi:MAG: hypothetical protein KDB88_07605, partial [Flavobacteriales bacterium]|nr:hypothetical protein [Flavobacteriales bacterium]
CGPILARERNFFNMPATFAPDDSGSTQRPDMISGLGILSFVNIGLFILIYGLAFVVMLGLKSVPEEEFIGMMRQQVEDLGSMMPADQLGMVEEIGTLLYHSGAMLMLIYLLRTLVRGWGVLSMWRGRKSGFTVYAAAQVIGIFAPHIILPFSMMGLFGPILTIVMVVLYGTQRKRLT